jgi:hypothetical protein
MLIVFMLLKQIVAGAHNVANRCARVHRIIATSSPCIDQGDNVVDATMGCMTGRKPYPHMAKAPRHARGCRSRYAT